MTIYLLGVSNVGKTTAGELLAYKLDYVFYDLDEEVKSHYAITLEEFVNTGTLEERDQRRGEILQMIVGDCRDKVIAVTPITYTEYIKKFLRRKGVLAIELYDSPENIFDRLVFSDENDIVYHDDDYKNARKSYYLREIREDIIHYERQWKEIVRNKFDMKGEKPAAVVERLIQEYNLNKKE